MLAHMTLRSFAWRAQPIGRLIVVLAISLVLAACGQGGDGAGY